MRFEFTESADFAAALGLTYDPVNKSYDRRETLEQENDKTRLANAEMPVKLIKELIDFSPKAKQMYEGLQDNAFDRNTADGWDNTSTELTDTINENIKKVYEIDAGYNYIEAEAIKNKDNPTLNWLKQDGVRTAKNRDLFMLDSRNMLNSQFNSFIEKNYPDGFNNEREALEAFNQFRRGFSYNMSQLGYNGGYIKARTEDTFDDIKANFLQKATSDVTANYTLKNDRLVRAHLNTALNVPKDHFASAEAWVQNNLGKFDGNTARAWEFFLLNAVDSVSKGTAGWDNIEEILYTTIDGNKKYNELLIEKLGGSQVGGEVMRDILLKLEEGKKTWASRKRDGETVYATEIEEKIKLLEEDGPLGKAELAKFLRDEWDWSKGGALPQSLLGRLTKEDVDDFDIIAILEQRYKIGEKIFPEDINQINDTRLRDEWTKRLNFTTENGQAIAQNPLVADATQITSATTMIEAHADTRTKLGGIPGKTEEWINLKNNGLAYFQQRYAFHIKDAPNKQAAYDLAMADVKNAMVNNKGYIGGTLSDVDFTAGFDLPTKENIEDHSLNIIKAERHIKELSPDGSIINSEIIYGTEEYVEKAYELYQKTGGTSLIYDQIAEHIPGISGAELQYAQLQVYSKKLGLEEPIKSKVLLELEELKENNPHAYELLTSFKDPARVIQATIEAYGPESENGEKIGFNEYTNIIPELLEDYNANDENKGKAFVTEDGIVHVNETWLEQLQPEKGAWKKLPRSYGIDHLFAGYQYVEWDGEHWVKTPYRPSGKEWVGTIDGFVDKEPTYDEGGWHTGWQVTKEYTGVTYDYKNTITGYEGFN